MSILYMIPKRQRPIHHALYEELAVDISPMVEIPLLGYVAAGRPVDATMVQESIQVPASMVRRDTYALRVRGHSMIDDNIQDGDIIIIERRESAENGQTVVAMINGESVTLKRFYIDNEGIRLQPANPALEPIRLHNEEIQILGIVTGVIRTPA
jgi:repressor LexA